MFRDSHAITVVTILSKQIDSSTAFGVRDINESSHFIYIIINNAIYSKRHFEKPEPKVFKTMSCICILYPIAIIFSVSNLANYWSLDRVSTYLESCLLSAILSGPSKTERGCSLSWKGEFLMNMYHTVHSQIDHIYPYVVVYTTTNLLRITIKNYLERIYMYLINYYSHLKSVFSIQLRNEWRTFKLKNKFSNFLVKIVFWTKHHKFLEFFNSIPWTSRFSLAFCNKVIL